MFEAQAMYFQKYWCKLFVYHCLFWTSVVTSTFLLSCLISKLQKSSHQDSNPGQFFEVLAFVFLIYNLRQFWSWRWQSYGLQCRVQGLLKQWLSLILVFPSWRNRPHRDSNPGQFSGYFTILYYISGAKE